MSIRSQINIFRTFNLSIYYYSNNTIVKGKCHLFCYFPNNLSHVLIIEHFSIECHQNKT